MKRTFLFLAAAVVLTIAAHAQETDSLKYRVYLKDKQGTRYSLEHPQAFLSERAVLRRLQQGLAMDETDLPVSDVYLDGIQKAGARIIHAVKWDNVVLVSTNDKAVIERIAALPFVTETKLVWRKPAKEPRPLKRDSLTNKMDTVDNYYGHGYKQIAMSKVEKLHDAGFKGAGMVIAVIDGGFHNADRMEAMDNIRILGTRDFVNPGADVCDEQSHGMMVLSCIGMNKPNFMVGTAPEASFWLLRSEDGASEQPVEEDYWARAVEYADSVGVDVINTSLGYYDYDGEHVDYELRNLTGKYALSSRQAGQLAAKGIILVASAGNAGGGSWKKITSPGDADNILTVGAIGKNGQLASFSSIGTTADGRIKPDVVAVGMMSDVISTKGEHTMANGTSFASPIMCGMVACLWQALPYKNASQIIELVRQSGDRAEWPDNVYGWGIPDLWKAYETETK
ncbi:MAG: S8 family serine peptidase [Prevotellaceae bacterium]|jgi:hypothetical protein|nr:S8 family serine peptidase [Prevotellaceae bacterium]